jgi:hypothetical protein
MTLRTSTTTGIGALLLSGVTLLAACGGGGSNDPQVASLGGGASGATSTTVAQTEADTQQAMLDFAQCMREHGIDMPDPTFDDSGNGKVSIGFSGPPGEMDQSKMDAAQTACQSFLDKVRANMPPPDPAQEEEMKQKALAFAQCMRDHGVDMPDPVINTDGKGGVMVQQGGAGIDPNSPGFQDASQTCQKQVGMDDMVGGTKVPGGNATTGGGSSSGASDRGSGT